ncbi:50S ribosomal protein L23 [Candidatus Tenderia electrophaga]|jgi:large subunit ribosomal protein L23|uniref:Large ribosomal subunit protein uL23 n=1 Tax=Candidatus Tenderia electrophaga TaxID=1748243 RepID=A0A0S2TB56_9GAMM|nr:50S ribosomal protein L23 [Candidatus Tenderia electrophaga]
MRKERLMKVLLAPHVSEKSTVAADANQQFVFKVVPDANKLEIKKAVELMFDVKVDSVQVTNVKGKRKRFGQIAGRRADWKKAYVKLQPGQDIDFMGAQ